MHSSNSSRSTSPLEKIGTFSECDLARAVYSRLVETCLEHGDSCNRLGCCAKIVHQEYLQLLNDDDYNFGLVSAYAWRLKRARVCARLELSLLKTQNGHENSPPVDPIVLKIESQLKDIMAMTGGISDNDQEGDLPMGSHESRMQVAACKCERFQAIVYDAIRTSTVQMASGVGLMELVLTVDGIATYNVPIATRANILVSLERACGNFTMSSAQRIFAETSERIDQVKYDQFRKSVVENLHHMSDAAKSDFLQDCDFYHGLSLREKKNKKEIKEKVEAELYSDYSKNNIKLEAKPFAQKHLFEEIERADNAAVVALRRRGIVRNQSFWPSVNVNLAGATDALTKISEQIRTITAGMGTTIKVISVFAGLVILTTFIYAVSQFVAAPLATSLLGTLKCIGLAIVALIPALGISAFFAGMIQEMLSPVVNQDGFGITVKPFYGLFVVIAALFTSPHNLSSNTLECLLKKTESFKKRCDGLEHVGKWIVDMMESAVNFVRVTFLKMAPVCFTSVKDEETADWLDKAMDVIDRAADNKFLITVMNAEYLTELIKRGKTIQVRLSKTPGVDATTGFNQISKFTSYLETVEAPFKRSCCTMSGLRVRPTIVLLTGAPGVGKTQVAIPLICSTGPRLLAEEYLEDFQRDLMHFVHVRNFECGYWDGYAVHKLFMVMDDFMQARDTAGNPDSEVMNLMRCGSAFPNLLHMADLLSKGNTMFRSQLIILTSNAENFQPNSINEPEALNRRFDFIYRTVPKEKYCYANSLGGTMADRRLDPDLADGPCDTEIYEFHRMKWVGFKLQYDTMFTYDEIVEAITELGLKRQREHEEYCKVVARKIAEAMGIRNQGLSDYVGWLYSQKQGVHYESLLETAKSSITLCATRLCYDFEPATDAQVSCYLKTVSIGELNYICRINDQSIVSQSLCLVGIRERAVTIIPNDNEVQQIAKKIKVQCRGYYEKIKEWMHVSDMTMSLITGVTLMGAVVGIGALIFSAFKKKPEKASNCFLTKYNHFSDKALRRTVVTGLADCGVLQFKDSDLEYTVNILNHEQISDVYSSLLEHQVLDTTGRLKPGYEKVKDFFISVSPSVQFQWGSNVHIALGDHELLSYYAIHNEGPLSVDGRRAVVRELVKTGALKSKQKKKLDGVALSDEIVDVIVECLVKEGLMDKEFQLVEGCVARDNFSVDAPDGSIVINQGSLHTENVFRNKGMRNVPSWARHGGKDPTYQAAWAGSVVDQAYSKFQSNTCVMRDVSGKSVAGTITFIAGRAFVINTHYYYIFKELADRQGEDLSFTVQNAHRSVPHMLPLSCVLSREPTQLDIERDWMICIAPLSVQPYANITNFFIQRTSPLVAQETCEALFLRSDGKNVLTAHCPAYRTSTRVAAPLQYVLKDALQYANPTKSGDCGSWLVYHGPKSKKMVIYGIHSAGCDMGANFGTLIFQEDLLESLKAFGISGVNDTMIENQGYPVKLEITEKVDFEGDFVPLFDCTPSQSVCRASQIIRSPLYGAWGPSNRRPARLAPFVEEGEYIQPMKMAVERYGKGCCEVPQDELEEAATHLLRQLSRASLFDAPKEILTVEEAALGVEGDGAIPAVTRTTSPGFPYCLFPEPGHPGKHRFFGHKPEYDLQGVQTDQLFKDVKRVEENAKMGIRNVHIYTDNLKDELRSMEKSKTGKTRLFSGCGLVLTLITRMYYASFVSWIIHNRIVNGIGIGINAYGSDWTTLVAYLAQVGNKFIAGDFKAFDASLSMRLLIVIGILIHGWYRDGWEIVRSVLWQEIYNSRHLNGKRVYEWLHALPSGHPLTTLINSLANQILVRVIFKRLCPDLVFEDHVRAVVYGDDIVLAVSDVAIGRFNQRTMTEEFAKLNMTFTAERKDDIVPEYRPLSEITFLKRGFVNHPLVPGVFLAPLALEVVLDMPYWTMKTNMENDISRDKLNCALDELSLHGQAKFMEWAPKMFAVAHRVGVAPPVDYDVEWHVRLKNTTQQIAFL